MSRQKRAAHMPGTYKLLEHARTLLPNAMQRLGRALEKETPDAAQVAAFAAAVSALVATLDADPSAIDPAS